jgi:hypothetical protein
MKPIASRDIFSDVGDSIKIRLGDILILRSSLKALNKGDLDGLMPLAILVVGFFLDEVYFTLLGLDILRYSISKHTKKGLMLLNKRGKEIKISEDNIVQFFKTFARHKSSDTMDGLMLYLRTLVTNPLDLKNASAYKISKRIINMIEWPDVALITWASKHLRIPHQHIPRIDHLEDRQSMINSMIRLGTTRANTFSEKNKIAMGTSHDSISTLTVEIPSGHGAPIYNMGMPELTWEDRDGGAYCRLALSDHVVYLNGEGLQIDQTNVDQAETAVTDNYILPGDAVLKLRGARSAAETMCIDESVLYDEDDPDEMR